MTIGKNKKRTQAEQIYGDDFIVCADCGGMKPVNEVCACKLDSIYRAVRVPLQRQVEKSIFRN